MTKNADHAGKWEQQGTVYRIEPISLSLSTLLTIDMNMHDIYAAYVMFCYDPAS